MGTAESGFVWTDMATYTMILCLLIVAAALFIFFRYGKKPVGDTASVDGVDGADDSPLPPWGHLRCFPPAIVGQFLRGQSPVGASEFIATLMSLARSGNLIVEPNGTDDTPPLAVLSAHESASKTGEFADETMDSAAMNKDTGRKNAEGENARLRFSAEDAGKELSPVEIEAVELLHRYFCEDDGSVHLNSVRALSEARHAEVQKAYNGWKELVKSQAADSVTVDKIATKMQKLLLYGGYVLIIVCALSGYLLSLMVSAIFLVAGGILIVLSLTMQNTILVERRTARALYTWLDSLETHSQDIPQDRTSIRLILEYAVTFGIGDKVSTALQNTQASNNIVDEEVAALDFWKRLKRALYPADEQ
ncbi:MAG: DUF2207 domain-containing protein [Coriobacteriales bacterium]|jgi:hypothetical protein|nr:DUF2207 domain-containing protein [Coriobacteriales bacterium]